MSSLTILQSGQLSISNTATKLPGAPVNASFALTGPTMTLYSKTPGTWGNNWQISIVKAVGANKALSHDLNRTTQQLTITLATNGSSVATTTGQNLADYLASGSGNGLLRYFSYTLLGSASSVITETTGFTNFTGGLDGAELMDRFNPNQLILTVSGQNIRYRVDGAPPTASSGLRVLSNTEFRLSAPGADYTELLRNISFISETSTATVDFTLLRE